MPQMLFQGQTASLDGVQPHQSIFEASSTPEAVLGQRLRLRNGSEFVYAKAGAVALVAGKLTASPNFAGSSATMQKNLALTASVVGDDKIRLTLVTDAADANQYAEGYVGIYDGGATKVGYTYQIDNHPAIGAGAAGIITLKDRVVIAITATEKACLTKHPYDSVVVYPYQTTFGIPIGVPTCAVPISNYFWAQRRGVATVLADGAWTLRCDLLASNAVDGALEVDDAAKAQMYIGKALTDTADTKYGLCYLDLP